MSINKYQARIALLTKQRDDARDDATESRKLANDVSAAAYEDKSADDERIAELKSERNLAKADARMTAEALRNLEREQRAYRMESAAGVKERGRAAARVAAERIAAAETRALRAEEDANEMRCMMTKVEMECDEDARHLRAAIRALKIEREDFAFVIARAQVDARAQVGS